MRTDKLNGAVLYPEFLTDDARLVLANVRSAQGSGAVVVNHAVASELTGDGLVATSTLDDNLGARIKAKLVVNAAGAWVDEVRDLRRDDSHVRRHPRHRDRRMAHRSRGG